MDRLLRRLRVRRNLRVMSGVDEALALEHVRELLASRFPTIDPTTVTSVVVEVHASLKGPVREYVPLLVERASRDRLRALVSGPSARGASSDARSAASETRGALTSA